MAAKADITPKQAENSKIHNAEEFSSYVHAVTIPMKAMMAAIVVFFAGALAFCVFGKVPVSISCVAVSSNECVCYVKSSDRNGIEVNDLIEIQGETYMVASISTDTAIVDESIDSYIRETGGLEVGDYVFTITVEGDVPLGIYTASIVKDYLNPIQVLLEG